MNLLIERVNIIEQLFVVFRVSQVEEALVKI
jgi:hypothetical protein